MDKKLKSVLPNDVESEPVEVFLAGYDDRPPEEAEEVSGEPMAPSSQKKSHLLTLEDILPYYDAVDDDNYLNIDIPDDAVLVPLEECSISASTSAGAKKHKKKKDKDKASKKEFLEECWRRSSGAETPPNKNTREIRFPTGIEISEKLTEHKLYCILKKEYTFGRYGSALYVRDANGVYSEVNNHTIERLLMATLTEEQQNHFSIGVAKAVRTRLLASPEVNRNQLVFPKEKVLLANGCFNIVTKMPEEIEESDFFACRINARYLPGQKLYCPNFDRYLETSSNGDESIKVRICAMLGYLLLCGYPGKKILVLGIAKNSGKSMISRFYQRLVSPELVCGQTPFDMSESHALSEFSGKIANMAMDIPATTIKPAAIGVMKALSGGDLISVNPKGRDRRSMICFTKQVLGTNAGLKLQQFDEAFWERVEIIPYIYSVSPEARKDDLENRLFEERDAIVTKCLKEARRLIKNGYQFPACPVAEEMKDSWIGWQAHAKNFLLDHCVKEEGRFTSSMLLYSAYLRYCDERNLPHGTKTGFIRFAKSLFGIPLKESPRCMIDGEQLRGLPNVRFLDES